MVPLIDARIYLFSNFWPRQRMHARADLQMALSEIYLNWSLMIPWCSSSFSSNLSNSVNASAVAPLAGWVEIVAFTLPAKPAIMPGRSLRTFLALGLTTVWPCVTWPSPIITWQQFSFRSRDSVRMFFFLPLGLLSVRTKLWWHACR